MLFRLSNQKDVKILEDYKIAPKGENGENESMDDCVTRYVTVCSG